MKRFTYFVYTTVLLGAVLSPGTVLAQSGITTTDTVTASVQEMKVKVEQLRSQVERYKKGGITVEEKIKLINQIIDLKTSIYTLKQKIVAMKTEPKRAEPGVILNTASLTLSALPTVLYRGETYPITWTSTNIENIGISLKTVEERFNSVFNIVSNPGIAAGQRTYMWTVPSTIPNDDYYLRLQDLKSGTLWSSGKITIMQRPVANQSVVLLSPNGGNQYIEQDSTYPIVWSTENSGGPLVLVLKSEDGTQYTLGTHPNPNAAKNTFNWAIPAGFKLGKYKIYLTENNTGKIPDQSDNWFQIVAPVERLASITPRSGTVGTEITLTGSYFQPTHNEVVMVVGLGSVLQYVDSPDTKTIKYTIPTKYILKGDVKFAVGFSNALPFTITEPRGAIDITPDASAYVAGQKYTFTWTGPELKDVVITITKGGVEVKKITTDTLKSGQSYDWGIPADYSGTYTIKAKTGNNEILIANDTFVVVSPTNSYQTWGQKIGNVLRGAAGLLK